MKKLIFISMISILLSFHVQTQIFCAPQTFATNQSYYAKIEHSGVHFYSTPNEISSLFEIPFSYFVHVESAVDDFYKANYNGVEGYVKKDEVSLMNGVPQNPYLQASYSLFVPYALYESASSSSRVVLDLQKSQKLKYLGTMIGEQANSQSNVWYYSCVEIDGENKYGYVFSGVTDLLTPIIENRETFDSIDEKYLNATSKEFKSLSAGTKIILIVSISVPSVLILYFLIKPSKIMQVAKPKKNSKKGVKKVRNKDYFEFDESEL